MEELRDAFDRVVGASSFILGEEVESFEREFATYCGVRHCVGVSSGTAALMLALLAAGVGAGDEVIVPAHTFIATALAVVHTGARPVFCDVEASTGLIDLESAQAAITHRTAALVPVHLYGQVCDMEAVMRLAERHGLVVIEDAAQAHGATYRGRRAGSFGTAAAFSFYPSKNLGGLGDGGAICTNDAQLAERARQLRHLGQRHKGEHVVTGFNERLDGLQAAMLRVKLPRLDGWNRARRAVAGVYRAGLGDRIELLEERDESPCIYHLFPIRVDGRDRVGNQLSEQGVACGIHYSPALHEQPPFVNGRVDPGRFAAASTWARKELSLPMYPELTTGEVTQISEMCLAAVERARV